MEKEDKEIKAYYCEECNMAYPDKKKSHECEEWCKKHKSCNIEIIKYAIKTNSQKVIKKAAITSLSLISIILILSFIASAHTEEDFAKAGELIKQKISCNQLSDEQLELIGEYYMEQMHPGELHEIMDERMGGEGSETLKQIHINIAKSFYCGESSFMSRGMMNTMMGRSGYGMMGNQGFYYPNYYQNQNNPTYSIINTIFGILIIITLIIVIFFLIKKLRKRKR
ncbi:MAG: hypothetical protein Q7S27_03130 [Nanoarchaeota archaeon]|nr:hypothetical protein [Nanoarchaeota archaeon]